MRISSIDYYSAELSSALLIFGLHHLYHQKLLLIVK